MDEKKQIWGSDLYYHIVSENGESTLYIEGSGPMPDYGSRWVPENWTPWEVDGLPDEPLTVEIKDAASIGAYAFAGKKNLQKVIVYGDLDSIGEHCFEGCTSLRHVKLPLRVNEIKSYAFKDCTALKEIVMPMFSDTINGTVFDGVNLSELLFRTLLLPKNYQVIGNCLYDTRKKKLITGGRGAEHITIAPETRIIADSAFCGNTDVKTISCPPSISKIGEEAFAHCTNLERIELPNPRVFIQDKAMYGCNAVVVSGNEAETPSSGVCRIAVTRHNYAVLMDGKIRFSGNPEDIDMTPLIMNASRLVDIRGGFDYILGLCSDGTVICAHKPQLNHNRYDRPGSMPEFPGEYIRGCHDVKSISASERRLAGVSYRGELFHLGEGSFEWTHLVKFKQAEACFDYLMCLTEEGDIMLLSDNDYGKRVNDIYRGLGEMLKIKFREIAANQYYYGDLTTAAITENGRVFWHNGRSEEPAEIYVENAEHVVVGAGVAAVLTSDGKAYYKKWGSLPTEIESKSGIAAVGIQFRDKIIVVEKNGNCFEINLQ